MAWQQKLEYVNGKITSKIINAPWISNSSYASNGVKYSHKLHIRLYEAGKREVSCIPETEETGLLNILSFAVEHWSAVCIYAAKIGLYNVQKC